MSNQSLYNLVRSIDRDRHFTPNDPRLEAYDRSRVRSVLKGYIFDLNSSFVKAGRTLLIYVAGVFIALMCACFGICRFFLPGLCAIVVVSCFFVLISYMRHMPPRWAHSLLDEYFEPEDIIFIASLKGYIRKTLWDRFANSLHLYNASGQDNPNWSPDETMTMCRWIFIDRYHTLEAVQNDILSLLMKHGNPSIVYNYLIRLRKNPLWFAAAISVKENIMRCIQSVSEEM